MPGARFVPGLLAGIVLFDLVINLPAISPVSPVASLLAPSLDLLVVVALLLTVARGGPGVRTGFAVGVAVLVGLAVGLQAYLRWGAGSLAAGPVAAGASFLASRLVYPGLADPVLRSLVLLTAALCAVIQALLGVRIFGPSAVAGTIRAVGEGLQ